MGLFDVFKKKDEKPVAVAEPKAKKPRKAKVVKTAKDLATEQNEPYVNIVSIEVDPNNIGNGAFELDWNDKFVANLVRAGYKGKTDQQIVDQWFQEICRNVVSEAYEQEQADPEQRTATRKKIDDNRAEFS
jgi:hypothetical protein